MNEFRNIKISIIIPVYNVQDYLNRCLDSVVNQSYHNLEIIVVDDGSKDDSYKIYDYFYSKDSRFIIKKQKNQGLSGARNTGIKMAKGEYIFFLDADDWLDKNYIEKCVTQIKKNNTDLLLTPYIREYSNLSIKNDLISEKCKKFDKKELNSFLLRRLFGENNGELEKPASIDDFSTAWGKFYKSIYCKNVLFKDTKTIGTEDAWFNINYILNISNAYYYGGAYYHYNKQNDGSLITRYNPNLYDGWMNLYNMMEDCIKENDLNETFSESLNNRIILDLMPLMRNIMSSKLPYKEKREKSLSILSNVLYSKLFDKFEFSCLPVKWRVFFELCKYKQIFLIYSLLSIAEPFKAKLK